MVVCSRRFVFSFFFLHSTLRTVGVRFPDASMNRISPPFTRGFLQSSSSSSNVRPISFTSSSFFSSKRARLVAFSSFFTKASSLSFSFSSASKRERNFPVVVAFDSFALLSLVFVLLFLFLLRRVLKPVVVVVVVLVASFSFAWSFSSSSSSEDEDTERVVLGDSFRFMSISLKCFACVNCKENVLSFSSQKNANFSSLTKKKPNLIGI